MNRPPSLGVYHRSSPPASGDVSLINEFLDILRASREGGVPIPVDQLPITQGLATLIADCVAEMRILSVDRNGRPDGPLEVLDDEGNEIGRTFPVLEQPNPEEECGETVGKLVQSLFWTGNGYALNSRLESAGAVDAICVLNPDTVGPIIDIEDRLRVAEWLVEGAGKTRSEITHWKYNDDPRRGPLGESPMRRCSQALDMYGWAYRYLTDYFGSGGNPSSILKSKRKLNDVEAEQHADDWVTARRRRRPAVLPFDLEFEVPNSSGDLQAAVEVLQFAASEVGRMCNVPPSIINAATDGYSLTYSNLSDEFRRWLAISLRPTWIRRLERGFSRLLPFGYWARLDPGDLFDEPATAPTSARPPAAAVPVPVVDEDAEVAA